MSLEKNYIQEGLPEGIPLSEGADNLSSKILKLEASLKGALQDTKETSRTRIDGLLQTAREAYNGKLDGVNTDIQKNQLDNMQTVKTRIAPLAGIVSTPEEAERNAHMKESLMAFFNNPANQAEIRAIENPDQIA